MAYKFIYFFICVFQCDERKPKVIRVAPCPMYCSFEDVHRFMTYLDVALHTAKNCVAPDTEKLKLG